jgi:hypothetical protein
MSVAQDNDSPLLPDVLLMRARAFFAVINNETTRSARKRHTPPRTTSDITTAQDKRLCPLLLGRLAYAHACVIYNN